MQYADVCWCHMMYKYFCFFLRWSRKPFWDHASLITGFVCGLESLLETTKTTSKTIHPYLFTNTKTCKTYYKSLNNKTFKMIEPPKQASNTALCSMLQSLLAQSRSPIGRCADTTHAWLLPKSKQTKSRNPKKALKRIGTPWKRNTKYSERTLSCALREVQ